MLPRSRSVRIAFGASAAAVLLAVVPALAASAQDDEPAQPYFAACGPGVYYTITKSSDFHIRGKKLPVFKDGPGGTITGSVEINTTVGATISAGAEAELSGVVASAKVSVSASLTASTGITIGHSYSRDITKGKYGNMQYGSWGKQVSWEKRQELANCNTRLLDSGTARIPSTKVGWKYWETKS